MYSYVRFFVKQARVQAIFLICFTALHCVEQVISFHSMYCMPGCLIGYKYGLSPSLFDKNLTYEYIDFFQFTCRITTCILTCAV